MPATSVSKTGLIASPQIKLNRFANKVKRIAHTLHGYHILIQLLIQMFIGSANTKSIQMRSCSSRAVLPATLRRSLQSVRQGMLHPLQSPRSERGENRGQAGQGIVVGRGKRRSHSRWHSIVANGKWSSGPIRLSGACARRILPSVHGIGFATNDTDTDSDQRSHTDQYRFVHSCRGCPEMFHTGSGLQWKRAGSEAVDPRFEAKSQSRDVVLECVIGIIAGRAAGRSARKKFGAFEGIAIVRTGGKEEGGGEGMRLSCFVFYIWF